MSKGRVEAFSDGVFAVAITILVFNIKVPEVPAGHLWTALLDQWPAYAAYVAGFLTIGVMWLNHHAMFHRLATVDRAVILLNLGLLMVVVFVPFPTELMGRFVTHGGPDATAAASLYAVTSILLAVGFSSLWLYALTHPAVLHPGIDREAAIKQAPRFSIGFLPYIAALVVAPVQPMISVLLVSGAAVYYAFESLPEIRHPA